LRFDCDSIAIGCAIPRAGTVLAATCSTNCASPRPSSSTMPLLVRRAWGATVRGRTARPRLVRVPRPGQAAQRLRYVQRAGGWCTQPGGSGACSRRRTTVRVRGHEVVPPPSAKGRQLRRCRRGGTAAVVRGVGHVRVVEREGHARRPRSSHRRRQVPGADGARWRGAEGGRRHSGGAGGSIRMLQADSPRPGRLLAHRSDRRRVSTRGSAHAGRGRLHGVGARTQGATQTQPPLSTL
jgi:hypothetical protein